MRHELPAATAFSAIDARELLLAVGPRQRELPDFAKLFGNFIDVPKLMRELERKDQFWDFLRSTAPPLVEHAPADRLPCTGKVHAWRTRWLGRRARRRIVA